ncbi:cyclic GMP-AMP synthase-like receptor isoform X2 [Argiope bruennichi]|uniref:cyclic GMP-AMP synthase-like receptor isoform X2 n=1 Tax=Argiope bruennichi TaxID=94029 RepID=UPI002494DA99|nr:cyclic GMP-AMP synthase-like receptor isoform X2 [Argiope bruennichi]
MQTILITLLLMGTYLAELRGEGVCAQSDMSFEAQSLQPKKLRKPGVTILKEILKGIKLDEILIKENNEILHSFLSSFIEAMKRSDEIFKLIYQRVHYTGSFYHDLRVSQPDEFDINLILNFGFKESDFEVTYSPQVPAYARYYLKNPEAAIKKHPRLLQLLFENNYLILEKVRKWIQSVVDKAMQHYTLSVKNVRMMERSSSGPARTIKLIKRNGSCIDIDLVPVFACTLPSKQPGIDGRVERLVGSSLETFLVPKPYSPPGQAPVNKTEITRLWRTHFPDAEKKLIRDIGCVKPVIKLLKLLRDQNPWKILASYYLKTVVMWMMLEHLEKEGWKEEKLKEHWKEDKLDERFIEALKKLTNYVEQRNIPYFFSKKNNLLSKIRPEEALNISGRLKFIIRNVEANPNNFWQYFNVRPTFVISNL